MKKIVIKIFLIIISLFIVDNVDALSMGRVTSETGTNLRRGPGANTEKLAVLKYNDVAVINSYITEKSLNGCSSGWYSVNYNGIEGYICSAYISKSTHTVRTNYNNGVNIRNGAGTKYSAYKKVSNNKLLTLSNTNKFKGNGCSSNWYSLNINTYKNKYICSNYTKNYSSKSNVIITNEQGTTLKNNSFENTDISLEYNQALTLYDSVLYTGKTYQDKNYKVYYQDKIYYIDNKDALNTNYNGSITNYNGTNIREGAGTNYNIEKKLSYAQNISLVTNKKYEGQGCSDGWYQIKLNNKSYYVCSSYVSLTDKVLEVKTEKTNIRKGKGTNYQIVKSLSNKTPLFLEKTTKYSGKGCASGWYEISLDGKKSYVCSTNTKIYESKTKLLKVQIEIENGTAEEKIKEIEKNKEAVFNLIPNKGYEEYEISCTNNQKYKIENNTLKIEKVTNSSICKVIYKPIKYEIKYDANTGIGTMENSTHIYDVETSLTKNKYTKEGYKFIGWGKDKEKAIYKDNETIKNLTQENNNVITLYAIWEKVYNEGDIVELKDGSKYFYLNEEDNKINLLAMYFLDQNGEFVKNSTEAHTLKFSENINNNYEESIIKVFLDEQFASKLKNDLKNKNVKEETLSKLEIGLPKAEIISEVGGLLDWTSTSSGQFLMNNLNKYFLSNVGLTYWTKTPKDTSYVWIVNKYYKVWYASPRFIENDVSLGIRPMITVPKEIIKEVISDKNYTTLDVVSSDYIIYDVNKNEIIKEKIENKDELWYPASVTKLTTLIVAIEEMERKNISFNDKVTITKEMVDLPSGESKAGFAEGDIVTYKDLLYGIINKSGGDACMALAISLKGSEAEFVKLMNEYAKKHNMTDTNYTNTRGLINVNNHYSSLKDVALGFKAAMENETFRNVIVPQAYQTTNGLNFDIPEFGDFEYLIGSKNGHAVYNDEIRSGYNQANYYKKDNQEYIVVTSSNKYDKTRENRTMDNYYIYKWLFQ